MTFKIVVDDLDSALYNSILVQVEEVKQLIKAHTQSKFFDVQEIINDVLNNEGKMLRPFLVLLASNFGRVEEHKLLKMAGSIEIFHMATLIHDDIIDEAKLRRNQEAIQSKYGKDMAVYTGDYLLAKAISLLNSGAYTQKSLEKLSTAISSICESELIQYVNRYNALSVKSYLRIISGKTAALFAISLYSGALESGCNEALSKSLGRIGYEIGMAFQIIDDLLDFEENQKKVGKSTFSDFKNGYYTLPILMALRQTPMDINCMEKAELLDFIKANSGIRSSKELARKYTKRAFKRIDELPDCEAKRVLKSFTEHLLNREY